MENGNMSWNDIHDMWNITAMVPEVVENTSQKMKTIREIVNKPNDHT